MQKKIAILLSILFFTNLYCDEIDKSKSTIEQTNSKLQNYQRKIDDLESKRVDLLNEYKQEYSNLQITKKYNEQLKKIISSQKDEIVDIDKQLVDIATTQKNIIPLMNTMIESLKSLVKLDTPFLLEERKNRIKRIEESMDRADISLPEKYRILLEAFKIEYDYSKSIETYQEDINNVTYNFLRVGRVGLYYQSLDMSEYGFYNKQSASWEKINDSEAISQINKGIKIANSTQNVDFLSLPFVRQ